MGARTRSFANLLNTDGTFLSGAINNSSLSSVTDLPTTAKSDLVLISTQTASASASISFTSGIDSTYDAYCFKFIDIHPANNDTPFSFNGSTDGGSNYNVTKTTTLFQAQHREDDASASLDYDTGNDIAQGTGYSNISSGTSNNNDASCSGELWLFNPSSTTYVKHFMSNGNGDHPNSSRNVLNAGYFNTTSAINAINFKFVSGNIDDGTIALYGLK